MDGTSVFQMVSGLGSSFGDAYSSAVKERQEAEAPATLENLFSAVQASRGDRSGITTLGDMTQGRVAPSAQTGSSLPTFAQGTDIGRYASAIQSNESGGKYGIVGPTHPKYGRALGAYQVMESNLPAWSREALGREVSPDEFLRSPQIQDAIFEKKFGQSVAKYGNPEDAASVWFTGRPLAQGANAKDVLGTTGAEYVRRFRSALGRVPAGTAPALPQTAMQMPGAGGQAPVRMAGAPAPEVAQPGRSSVAVAENEAETQALERQMGMVPGATQVASAEPDAANMPAVGAQPVGFTVPGAGTEAPSQAFPGFGAGGASQMTPELRTALNAAWKNPSTRAVAAQVFGQLLKGQDNGWELKDVNGQSAWVNGRDGRILPIGQAKRNTATVGNNLVDTATGDVLFTAPDRDSTKLLSVTQGTTLVDPVTRQPVFTAPRTERDEGEKVRDQVAAREAEADRMGLTKGSPTAQTYALTGKIGRDQELSATDKKAILEADEAVLSAQTAIDSLNQAKAVSPKAYFGPTAGVRGYATSMVGSEAGEATQDLSNIVATNALGQLKAIFGGNPTEGERKILLDIQGSVDQPDAVRQKIFDRGIALAQRRLEFNRKRVEDLKGGTFYKAQGEAGALPKGEARTAIPNGKSAASAISEARAFVKANPGMKNQVGERLRSWGIDPARLDE